jgi:hypothetical protein
MIMFSMNIIYNSEMTLSNSEKTYRIFITILPNLRTITQIYHFVFQLH